MEKINSKPGLEGLLESAKDNLLGLGLRAVVHLAAILLAAGLGSGFLRFAAAYIGIICLVPRGMGLKADWVMPSVTGLLQTLLLLLFGMEPQFALLFGGAQTWLHRVIGKKGKMGTEWAVLPLLLLLCGSFIVDPPLPPKRPEVQMLNEVPGLVRDFSPWQNESVNRVVENVPGLYERINPDSAASPLLPLATFPILALLGQGASFIWRRAFLSPANHRRMQEARSTLEKYLDAENMTPRLREPLRRLSSYTGLYCKHGLYATPFFTLLSKNLKQVGVQLDLLEESKERNKNIGGESPAAAKELEQLQATIGFVEKLSDRVHTELLSLGDAPKNGAPAPLPGLSGPHAEFYDSLRSLSAKAEDMPQDLRPHISGLCKSGRKILECMQKDQLGVNNGTRFLTRYLKAAHTVVDEFIRLSDDKTPGAETVGVLARSKDLILRLEQAFDAEYEAILKNEAMSLNAELSVLDTLLKMDGR